MTEFAGNAHWAEPSPLFAHRARPIPLKRKNEYLVLALGGGNCSSGYSRLYRLGVSQAQKAEVSGNERPRLCPQLSFFPLATDIVTYMD